MLRSSIERLKSVFDPAAQSAAALLFGPDQVVCVEVRRHGNRWLPLPRQVEPIVPDLWARTNRADPEVAHVLATILGRVAADLSRRYVPVHVVLADPDVHTAVFELDQVPGRCSERDDFARWRLAQALHLGDTVCVSQPLGTEGAHQLLLAQAVDTGVHRNVLAAMAAAHVTPWTLCPVGAHLFNHHVERLQQANAALVVVTRTWWSLWLCDAAGRLRQVRAHWREGVAPSACTGHAAEIERSVIAYVYGGAGRCVDRLLVACADVGDPLVVELAARAHGTCDIVAVSGAPRDLSAPQPSATLAAVAAALDDNP